MRRKARYRDANDKDFSEFQMPGHDRLVEAVGELPAQPREDEDRRNEDRERTRVQLGRAIAADMEDERTPSAFLRKLSLNAEKNWVQNKGAKRRVSSREEAMAIASGQSIGLGGPCGERS